MGMEFLLGVTRRMAVVTAQLCDYTKKPFNRTLQKGELYGT